MDGQTDFLGEGYIDGQMSDGWTVRSMGRWNDGAILRNAWTDSQVDRQTDRRINKLTYPNTSISIGLSNPNVCISLDFSCLCFTKRVEVLYLVYNVFDCKTENLNTHSTNIWGCNFSYKGSKGFSIYAKERNMNYNYQIVSG